MHTLLTIPSEIRSLIWDHLFDGVNARPSTMHMPPLSDDDTYCEPCLASLYPATTLPLAEIIRPLLVCRQVHSEALPHFHRNMTLHLHTEPSLQPFLQKSPSALATNLHHLHLTTHITIDNCLLWHQTLTKLFKRLASSSSAPASDTTSLSLRALTFHHHMNPPSSYEHLQLGIFYMSPLLLLPPGSTPKVTLDFAYRANYILFSSPFLGEVRCSDALGEHELVLRELREDAQFKEGAAMATATGRELRGPGAESESDSVPVNHTGAEDEAEGEDDTPERRRDNGEQIMAIALERVAKRHERTWLRGLQRARMHLLSPEMRAEVERALGEVDAAEEEEG